VRRYPDCENLRVLRNLDVLLDETPSRSVSSGDTLTGGRLNFGIQVE
jgi:hypothetical protein